ncbi:glycosyltransferase [Phycicoccus sonneratiae]|uniref:Glycosyltransferase n=1 Tax=Phycicoccus sonneratiae TaxID=2807628 RepID=A0ABS2CL20_9MICO|nr:glycosyltransferase [Phycicoccus sonneraticus]MBM6400523.1 glycosyltransferase [Phycicoccus sonneraticus]
MRIRYLVLNAGARGGATRTTLSIASALAERGHDVEVASLASSRGRPVFPLSSRVRLVHLTGLRPHRGGAVAPLAAARWATRVAARRTHSLEAHPRDRLTTGLNRVHDAALRHWLRGQRDCVVVSTRLTLNLALARHRTDRQVAVAQEHNHLGPNAEVRAAYRELFPRLDALAVLTDGDARAHRALLGERPLVVTVPNGVPNELALHHAPLVEPVAVAAGGLVRRKGFDLLVDAWRQVARERPQWRLEIHGSGEQHDALLARVHGAGLDGVVTLAGFTRDLPAHLDRASLFVLSSRGEGMPMVLLEAMASGVPVVSFDCPTGPAELLDGGRAGLLVPPGDVDALAAAILRVTGDAELRRRMADAGLARAAEYDVGATAKRWEEVFTSLAEARGLCVDG